MEIQTQIMIARELNYLPAEEEDHLLTDAAEIGRLLNGLLNSLRER